MADSSGGVIEPTKVYKPAPATSQPPTEVITRSNRNTYDLKVNGGGSSDTGSQESGFGSRTKERINRMPPHQSQASTNGYTEGMPQFFMSRGLVFWSWAITMGVVSWDEWHNNGILPRPKRLWYTSAVFLILAGLTTFDTLTPLVNALAIGFTISVLYNYYNGTGQFAHSKGSSNG